MHRLSPESERKLRRLIRAHEFARFEEMIVANSEECIVLRRAGRDDYSQPGSSRIGGVPDLPASRHWPQDAEGYFHTFLMQVNLTEMPSVAGGLLPRRGMLYFFLDRVEGDAACEVVFEDSRKRLRTVSSPPDDLMGLPYFLQLVPHHVTGQIGISIPGFHSEVDRHIDDHDSASRESGKRYLDLLDAALGIKKRVHPRLARRPVVGQLLGNPSEYPDDPCEHAYLAACRLRHKFFDYEFRKQQKTRITRGASQWRLLWRIDSDIRVKLCIGDAGDVSALIRRSDLVKGSFGRTYCEVDSA